MKFFAVLVFLVSISSHAADFDCTRVKNWPNYGGDANGWAVSLCKEFVLSGYDYQFEQLEKYREFRKAPKGDEAKKYEKLLVQSKEKFDAYYQSEYTWKGPLAKLHENLSGHLRDRWQICGTPWECTVVGMSTLSQATLCGNKCNGMEPFRLSLDEIQPLLETVISGFKTDKLNDRDRSLIMKYQKTLAEINANRKTSEALSAEIKQFEKDVLHPAIERVMEEYIRIIAP